MARKEGGEAQQGWHKGDLMGSKSLQSLYLHGPGKIHSLKKKPLRQKPLCSNPCPSPPLR